MTAPPVIRSPQDFVARIGDVQLWSLHINEVLERHGLALQRQAIGLAQHHTMDVFEPIAAKFPLQDIATLDELATELFGP